MLPPDVASRLRLTVPEQPTQPQPSTPVRQVPDVLSELTPGQRVLAEIQALLPNGLYRAVVAQRDITLALPFSAKTGDSLELEVVESDGKVSLAFVANRGSGDAQTTQEQGVATRLSQTGQLLSDLLGEIGEKGGRPAPAPLNGNQPLLPHGPQDASELAPLLKETLSKSGMFYEAHQARWVSGKPNALEQLLQEPQGKLSALVVHQHQQTSAAQEQAVKAAAQEILTPPQNSNAVSEKNNPAAPIPHELVPLVQQQLEALASQNYVWQGAVWPGQQMQWEIQEDGQKRQAGSDEEMARWQTRLHLTLPGLGGIDAQIRLQSTQEVSIRIEAGSATAEAQLKQAAGQLLEQFGNAGLSVTQLTIAHGEES